MKLYIPLIVLLLTTATFAHDTWVETDGPAAAVGDEVRIDLKLGNHGNDHRDFKVAGIVDLDSTTLDLITPTGQRVNLTPTLSQTRDGDAKWWTATHTLDAPGFWIVASTSDKVVNYAPKRSIKSAKAIVVAGATTQASPQASMLGHVFELVPMPGETHTVTLMFKGNRLANHRVSCVPRGVTLKEGFDEQYERMTDEHGRATFDLPRGTTCLIVAHHEDESSGEGYTSTKYSATITVTTASGDDE